ncbi:hypothetical protein DINM_006162 [Dirofilaria immitis]|nr:hypothetical protein [Dirofilaria immitis]
MNADENAPNKYFQACIPSHGQRGPPGRSGQIGKPEVQDPQGSVGEDGDKDSPECLELRVDMVDCHSYPGSIYKYDSSGIYTVNSEGRKRNRNKQSRLDLSMPKSNEKEIKPLKLSVLKENEDQLANKFKKRLKKMLKEK